MIHLRLVLGPLANNCYLVGAGGQGVVIDAPLQAEAMFALAQDAGLVIAAVLITHGHGDHIAGAQAFTLAHIPIYAPRPEQELLADPEQNLSAYLGEAISLAADVLYDEGPLEVAGLLFRAIHIPGHTPGSMALLLGDLAWTGDTLFQGSIGRTDLPGGNEAAILASLRKLARLPPQTQLFPGHGPSSTMAQELEHNPFLQRALEL